jgi:hypothetical protein
MDKKMLLCDASCNALYKWSICDMLKADRVQFVQNVYQSSAEKLGALSQPTLTYMVQLGQVSCEKLSQW